MAEAIDFEAAFAELEELVGKMEAGSLSLEESLAAFERGMKLSRDCQAALRAAELRIKELTASDDSPSPDADEIDDEAPF